MPVAVLGTVNKERTNAGAHLGTGGGEEPAVVVQEKAQWLTTPAFSWPLAELVLVQVAQGKQRNSLLGPWRQWAR